MSRPSDLDNVSTIPLLGYLDVGYTASREANSCFWNNFLEFFALGGPASSLGLLLSVEG